MKDNKRHVIQFIATVVTNANLPGFFTGRIWTGNTKQFCVPGLNCYSCPGALGACPIGALQNSFTGMHKSVPYYVLGTLILFGVLFARLICGFLCPFGFFQDLLHKIKVKKVTVPPKIDKPLRKVKYAMLLLPVVLLPLLITNSIGISDPWFCKYICPAGILEGAIPLALADSGIRASLGWLFSWKALLLLVCIVGAVLIYRPFCKYICPLGAFYGLFNRWSLYQMKVEESTCIHCNACNRACKMGVKVTENINSAECIRCGLCKTVCPTDSIKSGFKLK